MRLSRTYQGFLDALPDATALVDTDGVIRAINAAWKRFTAENDGDTKTYYLDRNYFSVCDATTAESGTLSSEVALGLSAILRRSKTEFRCEYPCHSPQEKRWFEVLIAPLQIEGNLFALVMHRNITSRKLQQIEIENSKATANELAALVATSTDAIISFDLNGNILTWNAAARALYGYEADEVLGQSMEILYPPDWPTPITEYRDEIVKGELSHFEVVRKTKSGALKNIAVSAAPVRSADGEVVAVSNFHRDITEQKKAEEHQKFITQELNHRTRNLLSVITAIEQRTAEMSDSIEAFHKSFSARLKSILASNELLVSSGWSPVGLRALGNEQLAMFRENDHQKIQLTGPPILLKPEAVQAIGMSFHELGTNSLKYGALSKKDGKLAITWQPVGSEERQMLNLKWEEAGIPIEDVPLKQGFGHSVLTTLIERTLGAQVDYAFHSSGLIWSINISRDFYELEN